MSTNVVAFKMPAHDHYNGPVCGQMNAYLADCDVIADIAMDPMNDYVGFMPELPQPEHDQCDHRSCQDVIHNYCFACEIEWDMQEKDQAHFIS